MLAPSFFGYIFTFLLLFPSISLAEEESLFFVFSLSDQGKQQLFLDDDFFYGNSIPNSIGISDRNEFVDDFVRNIAFITDGTVESNSTNVTVLSMLDDAFKVVMYEDGSDIAINEKIPPAHNDKESLYASDSEIKAFIHLSDTSSIVSHLSPLARSAYRLANIFGLHELSKELRLGGRPVAQCRDIIGTPYVCDSEKKGPFKTIGESLVHYSRLCSSCDDVDSLVLKMAAAHHLLRSMDKDVRAIGENIMHKNRDSFESLDMNYKQLNEIYLKSLSQK